jgi:hypothetical protein
MAQTAAKAQNAGIVTVPSATGGVDFLSSLFGMPAENAIRLTNWWPEVYGCTHRKGYREWTVGLPATVGSLYSFHSRTGQSLMYAFSGDGMYDVTARDTASTHAVGTPVVTGLSTSIWQATMFANSGGTHKVFVSGQDNPIWLHQTAPPAVVYDRLTAGDGIAPGTISGFNPAAAIDVTIHQKRLWFVEKDTTYGWYLPTEQVYGVASKFDFGPLFKRGGFLQSLATWTVGDGESTDDLLVAFSSEGDVVVYQGIDPNSIDTWGLKGVYYAGRPIAGHRFHCKVSGDLKFMTTQGLISMNTMFTSNQSVGPQESVEARPVQQFLAEQANLYGFLQGWDVKFVPSINMLIINIPSVTVDGSLQMVENTVNSKWSTFLGLDATCWLVDYQEVPFFGSGTRVLQGWTGNTDNVTLADNAGVPITALVQQAYNYFGTPANNKQVGLYRPNFLTNRSVAWKSMIAYDFLFHIPTVNTNPSATGTPRWDVAIWDAAYWTGGLHAQKQWASAEGVGFAGSLAMATKSDGEVVWVNTDYTVSSGGIL